MSKILIRTIYCFIASILFWNSFLAAFMLAIIAPMLPTMEAKMRTPTKKSMVTKAYLRTRCWLGSGGSAFLKKPPQ